MNFHTDLTRNIRRYKRETSLDRSFFTVIARARDGDIYQAERVIKNAHVERGELIADIATGQIENVQAVIEFNPREGWAHEISEDIAREVLKHCLDHYTDTKSSFDFLEDQLGCAAMARIAS